MAESDVYTRAPAVWMHLASVPRAQKSGVEDNSARSPQYTTVDGQIGFQQSKQWLVAFDVLNIADVKWNDIESYYVSRLKNEASPEADYVVHPGVPRTFRAHFTYCF